MEKLTPVQFDAARRLGLRHGHAWAEAVQDWPVRGWDVWDIRAEYWRRCGTMDRSNYPYPTLDDAGVVVCNTMSGRQRWRITRDGEVTLTVERPQRGQAGYALPGRPVLRARLYPAPDDRANTLALLAGDGVAFVLAEAESLAPDWGDRHLEALVWCLWAFVSEQEVVDLTGRLLAAQEVERALPPEELCLLQDQLEGVRARANR